MLRACNDSQMEEDFENQRVGLLDQTLLSESLFILFLRTVAGSKLRLAHLRPIICPRLTLPGLKVQGRDGSCWVPSTVLANWQLAGVANRSSHPLSRKRRSESCWPTPRPSEPPSLQRPQARDLQCLSLFSAILKPGLFSLSLPT